MNSKKDTTTKYETASLVLVLFSVLIDYFGKALFRGKGMIYVLDLLWPTEIGYAIEGTLLGLSIHGFIACFLWLLSVIIRKRWNSRYNSITLLLPAIFGLSKLYIGLWRIWFISVSYRAW